MAVSCAIAGVRGRPIAPLILTAQERAYLERQVRRHRALIAREKPGSIVAPILFGPSGPERFEND